MEPWSAWVSLPICQRGQRHGFMSWMNTVSSLDWDYDNLYTRGGVLMQFGNRGDARHNTYYKSLPEVTSGTGWLKHGISADPLFRDPSSGDVRLAAGSPCLDRGILLPGINEHFHGRAPDLGTIEFGP
jgi:hypothetical protein